jgi:hypothetical protein
MTFAFLSLTARLVPVLAGKKLIMARVLVVLFGAVIGAAMFGMIDVDEHFVWFAIPFGAYLLGMVALFD